jgi:hypothetical protein
MESEELTWRFWDKEKLRLIYPPAVEVDQRYESPRYVAMRRVRTAADGQPDLYAGDVVLIPAEGWETFYIHRESFLESESGRVMPMDRVGDVIVLGHMFTYLDRAKLGPALKAMAARVSEAGPS